MFGVCTAAEHDIPRGRIARRARRAVVLCLWIGTTLLLPGQALAQDADAGRKIFRRCLACHTLDATAPMRAGPHLAQIIGRVVGTLPNYGYTAALRYAGRDGQVWTEEKLLQFIEDPKSVFPKTTMNFSGLKDAQQRSDLLAYLKSQAD